MTNHRSGFIIPLVLAVVALIVIGGAAYIYSNKAEVSKKSPDIVATSSQKISVKVISPNGGETLALGENPLLTTIKWSTSNFRGMNVLIGLENDNGWVKTIAENIADSGSYEWKMDKTIPPGKYKIAVTSPQSLLNASTGPEVVDESDATFTIQASESSFKTYQSSKYGFGIKYPNSTTKIDEIDISGGNQILFTFNNDTQRSIGVSVVTKSWHDGVMKSPADCNDTASGDNHVSTKINGVDFVKYDVSRLVSGMNSSASATEYCAIRNGTAYKIIPKIVYGSGTPANVNNDVILNQMVASFEIN